MRRLSHLSVSRVRSPGVAEHSYTRLTRPRVTRFIALACVSALAWVPSTTAQASTPNADVAATREAVDAAAQRWFEAQHDAARIDARIAEVTRAIEDAQARVDDTRASATERAVMLYKSADVSLAPVFADDALDTARRAQLVDHANASSHEVIGALTAAVDDLKRYRHELEAERDRQATILEQVTSERSELDAQLTSLRVAAAREAEAALAAARDDGARRRAQARMQALRTAQAATTAAATAPPTSPDVVEFAEPPASATPVATPDGRVSAHHDDPFLVCTRARESGGNYQAVSPSGYYGAYQFLPSTWDATASHAGRMDLIGTLPSRASQYNQDEMAWALYQWQGNRPWGGRC